MSPQIPDNVPLQTSVTNQLQPRTIISKEEAARRQIETAIGLYLCDDDAVSVHVLGNTASAILTAVCRTKGIQPFRDAFISYVKPQYQKLANTKMNEAYNYFKHADRDAEANLENFDDRRNGMLLFSCCQDYQKAFGKLPSSLLVFFWWFVAANPEIMLPEHPNKFPLQAMFVDAFASISGETELEQRLAGRELLYAYLRGQHERPPVRGLCCA